MSQETVLDRDEASEEEIIPKREFENFRAAYNAGTKQDKIAVTMHLISDANDSDFDVRILSREAQRVFLFGQAEWGEMNFCETS